MNPLYIMNLIRQGQNPEQMMLNLLASNMQNSPIGENLLALAKNNKTAEIEQVARNLCKQRGVDFDKEFKVFKQSLGL